MFSFAGDPNARKLGHMAVNETPPESARHVKLFINDGKQIVQIPREFELPGDTALI